MARHFCMVTIRPSWCILNLTKCFTQEVAQMNKTMLAALAAAAMLLLNPLPGLTRGSQPQGSNLPGAQRQGFNPRGPSSHGTYQPGFRTRGSYPGGYSSGGYRGTYHHGGYRYGGYPYRGYYGRYPYRSNVYYSGGLWLDPGWGFWWGGPAWPYYYPHYSTPPVVIQQSPTEYIQRDQETEEPDYWYYCRSPEGYYPYIQRCPNGWLKVAPSTVPPDQ